MLVLLGNGEKVEKKIVIKIETEIKTELEKETVMRSRHQYTPQHPSARQRIYNQIQKQINELQKQEQEKMLANYRCHVEPQAHCTIQQRTEVYYADQLQPTGAVQFQADRCISEAEIMVPNQYQSMPTHNRKHNRIPATPRSECLNVVQPRSRHKSFRIKSRRSHFCNWRDFAIGLFRAQSLQPPWCRPLPLLLLTYTMLYLLSAVPHVRAACRKESARACEAICTPDGRNCTLRALLLLPDDDTYTASMRRTMPVLHLADRYIHENSLLPPQLHLEWMTGDVKCDAAYASIKAMDGIVKNCAHVVFGPVCDYALGEYT